MQRSYLALTIVSKASIFSFSEYLYLEHRPCQQDVIKGETFYGSFL
jgi:hypothetical protein